MLKSIMLISLFLVSQCLMGQKILDKRHMVGVSFGIGNSDVYRAKQLSGAGAYNGKGYFLVGITYLKPFEKWLDLEISVEYSHHNFRANGSPMPEMLYWNTDASLLTIPILAHFNFLKYFYGQAGVLVDIGIADYEFDNQNGVGGVLGIGAKYDFKNSMSVFINPYVRNHGIITGHNSNNERVLEYGARLGLLFSIGNKY